MANLNLQLEEPGDDHFEDQLFLIVKPALESGNEDMILSAAQEIVLLFPENDPELVRRDTFDYLCADMAKQIPFDHTCMLSLVALLEAVHESPRFLADKATYSGLIEGDSDCRYLGLEATLCEYWTSIWSYANVAGKIAGWANFHAFVAHLERRGIIKSADMAVTTLRRVFEDDGDQKVEFHEDLTLAAAQHVHILGPTLLRQVLEEPVGCDRWFVGSRFVVGPVFEEKPGNPRSLDRWRFWQEGFREVADGKPRGLGRKRISLPDRQFIRRVEVMMTDIEKEVTAARA